MSEERAGLFHCRCSFPSSGHHEKPGKIRKWMLYLGQCPAKSGLWGYNFITIKIACCTKQHIFATVLPFPFKFHTLVSTPFLCV